MSRQGRNSKSVEWEHFVAREKTKLEMRILQGKRKVRWAKLGAGAGGECGLKYTIV